MRNVIIAIDAGHSLKTAGKRTPPIPKLNGRVIHEHEFNRAVANKLIDLCKSNGIPYLNVSPNENIDMSLNDRIARVNNEVKMNPNSTVISISIHYNASGDGSFNSASGIEVFYLNEKNGSKELATEVYNNLVKGTVQKKRGVKQQNLAMLKPNCASILLEAGFMTELNEALLMINQSYVNETANEKFDAILSYLKLTKKQEQPVVKPTPQPIKETVMEQYKIDAIQWLIDQGVLTDKSWIEKADEPTPLYVTALIAQRLYNKK